MYIVALFLSFCSFALHADISFKIQNTTINLIRGDITKITWYDAIVNAANTMLSHDGGVALAISNAAGPELQKYSFAMPSLGTEMGEKLKTGQAVITPAFKLSQNGVKWIIHAVGPQIFHGKSPTQQDEQLLYNAYFNSLLLAQYHTIKRIAFPSISTALFGYDIHLATPIAKRAITDFINAHPNALDTITFVLFSPKDYQVFEQVFAGSHNQKTPSAVEATLWQRLVGFIKNLFGWK